MKKVRLKVNTYEIVARAVEEGVRWGWNRAHKHTDTPGEEAIKEAMEQAVLSELCEVIDFQG